MNKKYGIHFHFTEVMESSSQLYSIIILSNQKFKELPE